MQYVKTKCTFFCIIMNLLNCLLMCSHVNNYMREKLSENTIQVYMNSVYCCYVLFPRGLFAEMWILNIKIERMMPYESTPHAPPHSKIHPEEQADTAAHGHGQGEGRWFHE